MPPAVKTDKRAITDAVTSIIESDGWRAVSARAIADRLGISTQPIYREFKDMSEVKKAAVARGWELFAEYVSGDALDQSVNYVMFATERANLFDFLFRGKHYSYDGLDDLAHRLTDGTEIIDKLTQITDLPREKVYRLHLYVWMALHGLAAMSADNRVALDRDEIKNFARELTAALSSYYRNDADGE